MRLELLFKRINLIISKVKLCFWVILISSFAYSADAAISTVASEQSGTTTGVINHVGAGTTASRNNCGNISPSTPAGNVGDLLLAVALVRETNATVTASAGWTQYYTENHGVGGNQDLEGYIFYRRADGTANDNVTLTSGGTGNCRSLIGRVSRFDGVDTSALPGSAFETTPIAAGNSSTQNTANVTTGTETTTVATAMSIAVTFINDNATVTEANGFTQSFETTSTLGRDSAISLNYRQEASAGSKGPFTWSQNLGTDESIGVLFALKPDNTLEGISINVPTGTTTDDVMLATIAVRPSTTTITAPAGWTLLNRVDQAGGASNSQAIYHRVATNAEPTAYVWTFSGGATTGAVGGIITYRGVDTATPINASGGNTTVSGTSHSANSINTTVSNTMIVSTHSFSSSEPWTPPVVPAGMIEQVDVASLATPNALGISLEMNDVLQAAIGATGNITATVAGNADTGVAQIVALTPKVISSGITVTFAGGPIQRILAGSISVTDAALGPPEASATSINVGNSAAITTNITTIANNALLIDVVGKPRGNHSYTPGAGQIERWDNELGNNNNGATGAMSTKSVATAGATSMNQTHTSATRRNAHAVVSIAPVNSSSTTTFDAVASATNNNGNNINWTHTFATANTFNTKLIVGVTYRDPGACGAESISSITFGNLTMTQVAATSVFDGARCQYSELWYVDLNDIILSTNNNSTLGGQPIDQDEAVEYNVLSDTGSLFFNDATFSANERLTGLHLYSNGNVALATATNANIGGNTFQDDDIVEVTPSGTAGIYNFVQVLFDGGTHFTAGNERIDAVYVRNNGNIILSTIAPAQLPLCGGGNLNFNDDDLVEWNPTNNCATMFLDESATSNLIPNAGGDEDIVGVHLLNDDSDLILFSLVRNNTIRGTAVLDGDVVLYDRANDTASIFFSEANFTSGGEDIDALTLSREIVTDQVDHYEITYPNGAIGVTCEASQVTITAHDTGDNAVNVTGGTVLTINAYIDGTTTNTGTWDNATGGGTLAGNPGNPVTYTWPSGTEESSVTLELRQLTPLTIDIDLSDTNGDMEKGDGDNSDAEDPTIEFRDAVFRVVDNTASPVSITTKLSGKQSNTAGTGFQDLYLQAIETVSAVECQGVFESQNNVTVELASECNSPTTCETVQVEVEDDSATLQPVASNANASVTSYTGVQFDFDADSKTPLHFVYSDAGQITLHARYDIDPPNMVYMSGPSNSFTVRPAGLCVESLDANSTCPSADPNNPDCSTPFRKAGNLDAENFFNLTVRGVTWDSVDGDADSDFCVAGGTGNVTTPNFELSSITLATNLIAPSPGGTNAALGVTSIDVIDADKGTKTEANQSVDEVGVFTITATPPSYFGETIVAATSANIGRFYPDRFNVALQTVPPNVPAFTDSCSGFTYQDQTFYYGTAPIIEITALNSDGNTTNNYGGSFWRLTSSLLNRDYTDGSAVAPNASLFPNTTVTGGVTLAGDTDFDGIGTLSLTAGSSGDSFIYQKGTPESAFNADVDVTFLAVGFQDADHTVSSPVCYDAANDGTCDDFTHLMMQGTELRWGRMVLDNAFGSELLAIEVPLSVEYYVTNDFEINTSDTCTTYDSVDMFFSNANGVTLGNLTLTGSGTMVSGKDDPANSIIASSTANEVGSADVTINLTAQDWLQYDWDNDTFYDNDPTSRITWGIFSGPDEFIYIREPW